MSNSDTNSTESESETSSTPTTLDALLRQYLDGAFITEAEFEERVAKLKQELQAGDGDGGGGGERPPAESVVTDGKLDHRLTALRNDLTELINESDGSATSPPAPEAYVNAIVGGDKAPYQTVQDAWDDAPYGDPVSIAVTTGYDPTAESYPIRFTPNKDGEFKPLTLIGAGPSAVQLGHDGVEGNTIYLKGTGWHQSERPYCIGNLTVRNSPQSGKDGLVIKDAPFGMLENAVVSAGRHGINYCTDTDGCYGSTLNNVQVWNCGQHGVLLDEGSKSHSTHLYGCWIGGNGGNGINATGCYNVNVIGGTVQYNSGYGLSLWDSKAVTIRDVYLEGNASDIDYPVSLYGKNADGLTVASCYFNGSYYDRTGTNGLSRAKRGVNVHDSSGVQITNNLVRNYGNKFVAMFGGQKHNISTNWAVDETPIK